MESPDQPIHIACSVDHRMAVALQVLLLSLATNSSSRRRIICHINTPPSQAYRFLQLQEYLNRSNIFIEFFSVESASAPNGSDDIPAVVLQSLKVPEALPHVDRLLMLDADMIVLRPLGELFDTSLDGYAVAAAIDISLEHYCVYNNFLLEHYQASQYARDYFEQVQARIGNAPYLNSGVMLIDVQKWIDLKLTERCLRYLEQRIPCAFHDQDALNSVLKGDFKELDARWNAIALCCRDGKEVARKDEAWQSVRAMWRHDPWIVHYAGPCKPWRNDQISTDYDNLFFEVARTHTDTYRECIKSKNSGKAPSWKATLWKRLGLNS